MRSGDDVDLSVVIPCRGHAESLGACLDSVVTQRTSRVYEVIVVDSAADDAVAAEVRRFEGVRLVRSREPLLPGPARNLGVRHALGRCVAFLDADCVADPEWLDAAHTRLQDDRVRMAGGPVTDLLRGHWIASADNLLQFVDLPRSRPPESARHFPSCNMAMRKADFLALRGFPETLMTSGEDVLLCDAALSRWRECLFFEPSMAVRHAGRTTWQEYLRHHLGFGYSRALHRLHVQAAHLSWGRHALMIPIVALKRLAYVVRGVWRYHGRERWRILLVVPIAFPGMWFSAIGFRRGCRELWRRAALAERP